MYQQILHIQYMDFNIINMLHYSKNIHFKKQTNSNNFEVRSGPVLGQHDSHWSQPPNLNHLGNKCL